MQRECDVLVVGGGLAGFASALEAVGAGADVILIESQPTCGGSSAMSGGCLAFAGTDLQAQNGVDDSDEKLFDDLREVGQFDNDEQLVRAYVDNQLGTYRWMKDLDVAFSPVIEASSGQSVPRVHTVDPADLIRLLEAQARARKVTILTSTRAMRLHRNSTTGTVDEVAVEQPDGQGTIRARRGVILAAGGFCRNPELVHRFVPHYDEAVFVGGEGSLGDGLKMAWQLGADFRDMAYIKGTYGKHPTDTLNHHSCLAVYKGAIAVNQDGRRFVDESISYKLLGDACMAQPWHVSYQIFDEDIFQSGDNRVRILDFERRLEDGLLFKADTLDELARQIEVDPAQLAETVARYNGYVDEGEDPDFGREYLVHKHGGLQRIDRAPYYAYPSTASVFGTYCGLCVTPQMQVIDVFGAPIGGLYAAGEVVGGLHGGAYMTGSALGKAAIFGRIAGRTVAGAA